MSLSMNEHYKKLDPEPIDVITKWQATFCIGCVIKYLARAKHKGTMIPDLKKAIDYLYILHNEKMEWHRWQLWIHSFKGKETEAWVSDQIKEICVAWNLEYELKPALLTLFSSPAGPLDTAKYIEAYLNRISIPCPKSST